MRLRTDRADVGRLSAGMPWEPVPVLPGLSFLERPQLFASLVASVHGADGTVDVFLNDRRAVVVLDAKDARAVLSSRARKGRPATSLKGVQGHIAEEGPAFQRRRGAVMASLQEAAREPFSGALFSAIEGGCQPDDLAPLLMAHLAGTVPSPALTDLCRRARVSMRAATDGTRPDDVHRELGSVYEALRDLQLSSSAFVRGLLGRGWSSSEIAAEIVTLTFAGWASLAAVIRTAQTLGVGGPQVAERDITELLRIAPPGWLITRESVEPFVLSTRDEPIDRGTLLVMSPWLLHRDPAWWERPGEFDAARQGSRSHTAYLPFSAGKRGCPAEVYSRAFLQALLLRHPESNPSPKCVPALIDERSTCLVPQEDH